MDILHLAGIAAGIVMLMVACIAVDRHFRKGATAVDPQARSLVTALHQRIAAVEAGAAKVAENPVAAVKSAAAAVEADAAELAMNAATKAVEFILDDSGDNAVIAAANARKAQRATMGAALTAKLAGPAAV